MQDTTLNNSRCDPALKVDGKKYLVALDRQAAQLWEKVWGLKKA